MSCFGYCLFLFWEYEVAVVGFPVLVAAVRWLEWLGIVDKSVARVAKKLVGFCMRIQEWRHALFLSLAGGILGNMVVVANRCGGFFWDENLLFGWPFSVLGFFQVSFSFLDKLLCCGLCRDRCSRNMGFWNHGFAPSEVLFLFLLKSSLLDCSHILNFGSCLVRLALDFEYLRFGDCCLASCCSLCFGSSNFFLLLFLCDLHRICNISPIHQVRLPWFVVLL